MADKKITQLTNITGANLVDADEFVVVDISADETKAITLGELKEAFDSGSGFVRITGDTMTGNLSFGDNDKAIFGAGSDLQIYHNGSNSIIQDAGTGNLIVKTNGNNIQFEDSSGNDIFKVTPTVTNIYHGTSGIKLSTTSTGVDITGTLTSDGLTVEAGSGGGDGSATPIGLTISDLSAGSSWVAGDITSAVNYTSADGSGAGAGIRVRTGIAPESAGGGTTSYYIQTAPTTAGTMLDRLRVTSNGDISFYDSAGSSQSFFWDASAESLGIGTTTPSSFSGSRLVVRPAVGEAGTNDVQSWEYTSFSAGSEFDLRLQQVVSSGLVKHQFNVRNAGTDYTSNLVLDRGNVGIGTDSPDQVLHVEADAPVFRLTNPQTTSSLDLSMGKIEWETRDSSAPGVIGYIDVVDSNNFGTTFDMSFATGQSGSATERMRIDSSGNVGIGTDSPSGNLHVYQNSTAGSYIFLENTDGSARFQANNDSIFIDAETHIFRDSVAGGSGEYMRIDSSGNLLVGATTTSGMIGGSSNDGSYLASGGGLFAARSEDAVAHLNRLSTDGEIIELRKDGTTVGSIGSYSGTDTYITGGTGNDHGIVIGDGYIVPSGSAGASNSNVNLGLSASGRQFKDLYLSGGVYLGGTGSANKLDDYEEGTWTVTTNSGTVAANSGFYRKVGDLVYATAVVGTFSDITSSSEIQMSLPFTSSNTSGINNHGSVMSRYIGISGESLTAYIGANSPFVNIYHNGTNTNNWSNLTYSDLTSTSAYLRFSISYIV